MNIANILSTFYNNMDGEDIILLAIIFLVQNSKRADQAFMGMLSYIFLKDYGLKKRRSPTVIMEEKVPEALAVPNTGSYYYSGAAKNQNPNFFQNAAGLYSHPRA